MAFTFAAFAYIVALIIDAFLIFFAIFHVSILYQGLDMYSSIHIVDVLNFHNRLHPKLGCTKRKMLALCYKKLFGCFSTPNATTGCAHPSKTSLFLRMIIEIC